MKRMILGYCAVALAATSGVAFGQKSSAPPAPAPDATGTPGTDADDSGEILVTARRKAEKLESVPLSIVAFGQKELERRNVQTLQDVPQIAPGVTVQATPFGNSALSIQIRGQRQALVNLTYDPAVSVYLDEVVQGRAQGLGDAFFDVESVQVLKGPQGTLFGRNTTGGAILITSRKPTDEFEGYVRTRLGNYNLYQGEGAVNVPVAEALQLRFAGVITRRHGYMDDPTTGFALDNQRTESWRASARLAPADNLESITVISGFHESDGGVPFKLFAVNPATLAAPLAASLAFLKTQKFHTTTASSPRNGTRITTLAGTNITTLDLGGLTLKNIFGLRRVHSFIYFDLDGSERFNALSQHTVRAHQLSEEGQALGKLFDDSLEYVLGGFYFREKGSEFQPTDVLSVAPTSSISTGTATNRSAAVYGQLTYHLPWLEGVSLTGGLRETWDRREYIYRNQLRSGVCRLLSADVGGLPLNPCEKPVAKNFSKLTYSMSADWKINADVLAYVAHRYGYQTGGFTNSATRPSEFAPYQPQTVSDIELGLKASWGLGPTRGRTNIALYRGKYKDIQRFSQVPTTTASGLPFSQNVVRNAAGATVQGIELEQSFNPVPELTLSVNYAYTDASYDRYVVGVNDFTAAPFAGVPKNSVAGSIRVALPWLTDAADVSFQLDGSYLSRTVVVDTSSFNPVTQMVFPSSKLPGYGTINASLEAGKIGGRSLDVRLWVRNLTKEEYYTAGQESFNALGTAVRLLGAPRTFGIDLRYDF